MVRCKDCRFWHERDGDPLGECRFDPPRFILIRNSDQTEAWESHFPESTAAMWCGKAKPRDEAKVGD